MRARLVRWVENHPWSSAGPSGLRPASLLTTDRARRQRLAAVKDWSAWLAEGDEAEELATLRRNVDKGLPRDSEPFLARPEALAGRSLRFRPVGRPRQPGGGNKG